MTTKTFTQRGVGDDFADPLRPRGPGVFMSIIASSFAIHCVYVKTLRPRRRALIYTSRMPKLWTHAVETHRRAVRDAALETAAALVAKQGLRSVTMAQIAEEAGIGRATLYKYFPDVESMLAAWHERQVSAHLEQLEEL